MDFAFPPGLWAFFALVPFILLYLIRPRPKQMGIPSLMFFVKHSGSNKITSFFRNFMKDWLFLLQLLILVLLAFAMARPFIEYDQNVTAQNVVIVLDASASMQTREGGTTRFAMAKKQAKDFLGERTTVVLAKEVPLIGMKNEKPITVEEYINGLEPTDTSTRLGDAILLAGEALDKGRVVVLSDFGNTAGQDPSTAKNVLEAKGLAVDFINVGTKDKANMGITDMTFGDGITAIVTNTGVTEQTRTLRAGNAQKKFSLQPGESDVFSFAEPSGVLRLELDGQDDFKVDDVAYVSGSATKNLTVLLVTNNKSVFLESALLATGFVSVTVAEPPIVPKDDYDVFILHNIDKNELLPGTLETIKNHVEKGSLLILHAQKDSDMFDYKGLSPVTFSGSLDKSNIVIQQQTQFTKDIDFGSMDSIFSVQGGEVYATAAESPVLASKPLGNGQLFYFGLVEEASDFKFTPDYPIFWNSLLRFLSGHKEAKNINYKTGQQLFMKKPTIIQTPQGRVNAQSVSLEHIGSYTADGITYSASLLNLAESSINQGKGIGQKSTDYQLQTVQEKKKYSFDVALLTGVVIFLLFELLFIKLRGDV